MRAGLTGAGLTGAGTLAAGPTGAGPLAAGPMGAGPMGAGPLGAGPTGAGPLAAGPTMAEGGGYLQKGCVTGAWTLGRWEEIPALPRGMALAPVAAAAPVAGTVSRSPRESNLLRIFNSR